MSFLVPVYFPGPSGFGKLHYRKALVYKEDVDYFLKLGSVLEQPAEGMEIIVPTAPVNVCPDPGGDEIPSDEEEIASPDKGYGVPGSFEWHKTQIDSMRAKKEIIRYANDIIKKDATAEIDDRKPLTVVKLRAKKLIKEFLENVNQS